CLLLKLHAFEFTLVRGNPLSSCVWAQQLLIFSLFIHLLLLSWRFVCSFIMTLAELNKTWAGLIF
ncbi:hypothetical protein D9O29_24275, partial [Pantoea vagans]